MRYAIDITTGKQIHADDGSRYRTYRCPVCKGKVFLRSGQQYASHFAHRHDTAKLECELYTPGTSQLDPHRMPAHPFADEDRVAKDVLQVSPPDICLEVEDRQSSGRGRIPRWKLCITIPKSPDGRGTITFDFGAASLRTIALSKLFGGLITYPVELDACDYKAVWCSPETNPTYREIISERRSGLNKRGVTPFMSVQGRYKPRARRLVWGRAYYFVWPKSFDAKFPSALEVLALENNKDWSCALSVLPESRDEVLSDWLERVCSIAIETTSAAWSLLYPFLSAYSHDGQIEVPVVGHFIFGYDQSRETGQTEAQAHAVIRGERIEMQLPAQSKNIVALNCYECSPDVFQFNGKHQVSFKFCPLERRSTAELPMVWGEFQSPTKGLIQIPLHVAAARKWIEEVRGGRAQLIGILLPEIVEGELIWRGNSLAGWNHLPLNRRVGRGQKSLRPIKLAQEELEQIQVILRSARDEVRLSFRGFGEHHFLGVEDESDQVVRLSRRLRDRMLWLQKEISCVYRSGQPVANDVSDHELIHSFLAMRPPPSLAGHYQSICRSIGDPASKHASWSID